MRAVREGKADAESHEAADSSAGGGGTTLADAQQKEQELREGLPFHAKDSPYEDVHSQREDKERDEQAFQQAERSQHKQGLRPGTRQGTGQRQPGAAQSAPRQQGAQQLARQPAPGRRDGFESSFGSVPTQPLQAKNPISTPPIAGRPTGPMQPMRAAGGAIHVLNSAQEPGVYFREEEHEGSRNDEQEDPELADAVEECIRLLFGVRGIHRVGPGTNDAGQPVIIISVNRGFSQSSMGAIPEQVHRFKTLVALPYDLLPLKRDL